MLLENNFISSEYVNSLNDDLRNFIIYLNSIYDNKIIDNPYFTKICLNMNNEKGNYVLYLLAKFLHDRFFNKDLYNSYSISDEYKYSKMICFSSNLLFVKNNDYYNIFNKIVHPSVYNFYSNKYEQCIEFFNKLNYDLRLSKQIIEFIKNDENKYLIDRKKSIYHPYQDELRCLKEVRNGIINNDYKSFLDTNNLPDTNEIRKKYINKKTGNIGEYITKTTLSTQNSSYIFVSKDISDGVGFDFLVDGTLFKYKELYGIKEILLEAKASLDQNNPNFYLTNNEYSVMLKNLHSRNALYLVSKTFVNTDINGINTIDILMPTNELTFKSIYPHKIEYTFNNNIVYKGYKTFSLKK